MGYDVDRFLSHPPDVLVCVICSQVAEKPVVGCADDDLFCLECLEEWLKVSSVCPVDRQALTSDDVKPASRLVTRILMSLPIKCTNYKYGCDFVSTVEDEAAHTKECEVEVMSNHVTFEEQLLMVQELIKTKKATRNRKLVEQEAQGAEVGPEVPIQELNILILAETGVGKSTFINSFANYVNHPTLEEAMSMPELTWVIPTSFTVTADGDCKEFAQRRIIIGNDDNEITTNGTSATQAATPHVFDLGHTVIRLIDTPGIGDTRGTQKGNVKSLT